ncbi:hypothetical protein GH714_040906 [Hevea brasiliensis]|uniref:Flavonoid 3'-hydroxylase n=1 Tax=Hevea brasiliensis TaxID=3981 RepID=A0A6A6MKG6_HEVBR|nr:hypothetical protein GH714_040906 [Hevea brasiliensis]
MSTLIFYSIAFATFLYFLLHLRQLFLHRASRPLPPGPKPWPLLGNLPHLGPKPHHSLADLARIYGPLMHLRMGFVDVVVAASASVAAQFLKVHDANFSNRPPNSGAKYVAYNYQDLVFAPYGPRGACLGRSAPSTSSPARRWMILDTLDRRVFNDGSSGGDPKADEFKSMVVELMVLAGVFNIGDFIPALEWLDLQGVAAKMKKLHKRFDDFLTEIVEEHKIKSDGYEKHRDMLSTLISLKEDADGEGEKLTDTEIKALLLVPILLQAVEWAIAELIRHPNILAQVQQELDSVVGRDRLVNELDLAQLTYLQAVVRKPSASTHRHPRDPDVWAEPLKFRPERFLAGGEKANVDVRGNDFELIPFGAGRRICAGMNLGLRMVHLLIATLAHAFEWELADGLIPEKLNMEEAYGLTLQRAVPMMVHPRPRLSSIAFNTA